MAPKRKSQRELNYSKFSKSIDKGKDKVPLVVLEKRLAKLKKIVKARGGKA